MTHIGRSLVPSVYRAFAYLGSAPLPLPSIVAPLGPLMDWQTGDFWRSFYAGLAETLAVEEAMSRGQATGPPTAMALFLRHPHGRLFRRSTLESKAPPANPAQIDAELQVSRGLVEQVRTLGERFGVVSDEMTELLDSEIARQQRLAEELAPWLEMEDDEL